MLTYPTTSVLDTDFLAAVHAGLGSTPKTLPCRYFYDRTGSLLFEEICGLPEYYLTRTEDRILHEREGEIVACLPSPVEVIELGSGSSRKTRRLLEALLRRQPQLRYTPVDISASMLRETAVALQEAYPRLTVSPLAAEYGEALTRLRAPSGTPRLILFLGSNLGNFDPEESTRFLRGIRGLMQEGDCALIGLDLQKDRAVLEAAYDDAQGITAAFNRNLLRRINRELGGDFDYGSFRHRALYNADAGRVEMHLESTRPQEVTIQGRRYPFREGETIHTENSYKFTRPGIRSLAARAGLLLARTWTDEQEWFSVNLLAASAACQRP